MHLGGYHLGHDKDVIGEPIPRPRWLQFFKFNVPYQRSSHFCKIEASECAWCAPRTVK